MPRVHFKRMEIYDDTAYGPGDVEVPASVAEEHRARTVTRTYYSGAGYVLGIPAKVRAAGPLRWRRPTAAFLRDPPDKRWEAYRRIALAELDALFPTGPEA